MASILSSLAWIPLACIPPPFCSLHTTANMKDIENNNHQQQADGDHAAPLSPALALSSPPSATLGTQAGLSLETVGNLRPTPTPASLQERILSAPGSEEAIERLKVGLLSHFML